MSPLRTPILCGFAAVLTGVLVIVVGWALDVEVMRSIVPGTVGMKASTATMFVLCGTALVLMARSPGPRARRVAFTCAVLTIAYAGAFLCEYVFDVNLGIDEFPFRDEGGRAQGIAYPGRLAPLTALSFVLTGLAILAMDARLRLVEPLIAPAAAIGATCLIGYLYSIPAFYGPASAAKMAINTALLFLALSIGILLARPRGRLWTLLTTESPGGIMARRLLPLAVTLPLLLGWLHLEAEDAGWLGSRAAAWWLTATTIGCLLLVIGRSAKSLSRGVLEAQRRFESAFQNAPIGIALVGVDGRVMQVNKALSQITGYGASALVGERFIELAGPAADGSVERPYTRRDGSEVWVRQSETLVRDADENAAHFIVQVEDVSRRRADAEALADAKRELEAQVARLRELDHLKEEFVAVVTHELRTPLTSVAGYLDIVLDEDEQDEPLDPQVAHCVGVARRNSQRLIDLVEDLLLVRRLEAGREQLAPARLDLSQVTADRLESIVPMAAAKRVTITGGIEPGVIVEADARRLAQMTDNLLSNAVKYTPEDGSVSVALRTAGDRAELVVTDTGIGIPEADHEALFNPFFRASNVSAGLIEGTGLGLVVTRRLVEAHGGTIEFESAEGEGSTFVVTLPLAVATSAAREPEPGGVVRPLPAFAAR